MNNRVLALDLSLSSPGFAVISVEDGKPYLLEASHVKTDAKKSHGERLDMIQYEIDRYIDRYTPLKAIVREKGFSRFPATTQTLFKVVGISDWVSHRYGYDNIEEISPTSVKKLVTGDGKSNKADVERAVRIRLGLSDMYKFETDDSSDACAVGLAYLIQKGVIE